MKIMNDFAYTDLRLAISGISRRKFLASSGLGLGSLALACLLDDDRLLADESTGALVKNPVYNDQQARPGHFPGRAR